MPVKYPHTEQELKEQVWVKISEERAQAMLGAVPPFYHTQGVFALGELWSHLNDGSEVALMVAHLQGSYYEKPCKLSGFNPEAYVNEIASQPGVEVQRCCECNRPSDNPEGVCYECQCTLHALGAYDMDGNGWRL